MKILLLTALLASGFANAQTTVPGGWVSGNWTLSGSPYTVQGPLTVTGGQTLTIEAGVEVRFAPESNIRVNGQLIAVGTASQPIVFHATDTTGWSNDAITTGGWNGIHFHAYAGTGSDQSQLDYCVIKDVKYGFTNQVIYTSPLTAERAFTLRNTVFEHNRSGTSGTVTDACALLTSYGPNDNFIVENCTFRNNPTLSGNVKVSNFNGGTSRISGNRFYGNSYGISIFAFGNNGTLIENNEIYDNTYSPSRCAIKVTVGEATIRGNHVHHNHSEDLAAVTCKSGYITLENNFIHNNYQADAFCGATAGGGGMHLAFNEGSASAFNVTYYTVRNNIIANNYSSFGGGGIYVYNTRATISNNHIVNNDSGDSHAKCVLYWNPATEIFLKNNILFNWLPGGNVDTESVVYGYSANTLGMDYNFIPSAYHTALYAPGGYTLVGDTTHNVVGLQPGLSAATADNSYLTDATSADFQLLATSPCIDAGDTVSALAAATDYSGNARMNGPIDIGAFEYGDKAGINAVSKYDLLPSPNPAGRGDVIRVKTPGADGELCVRDLSGKLVYVQGVHHPETELSTNEFAPGSYLIVYRSAQGIFTGKIVIR